MITGLIILQTVSQTAGDVSALAQTQHAVGEWSVNGAAFIIFSIILVLGLVSGLAFTGKWVMKQFGKFFEKSLNTSSDLKPTLDKVVSVLEETTTYLKKVNSETLKSLKVEATENQIYVVLKAGLRVLTLDILEGLKGIIRVNHISDKEYTEERVRTVLSTIHYSLIDGFNNFKIEGRFLGELIGNAYLEKEIKIALEYIYSADNKERRDDVLLNKLETMTKEMTNAVKIRISDIVNSKL